MSHSVRKAKILWQCRRGMLELDLMLLPFIEKSFDTLSQERVSALEKLLGASDPELYSWLMGSTSPEEQELQDLVKLIQMHSAFQAI